MFSAWVYPTAFTTDESSNGIKNLIVSKEGTFEIGINESGYVNIFLNVSGGSASAFYGTLDVVPLDAWTRIIFIYNGSDSNSDVLIGDTWYYSALGA